MKKILWLFILLGSCFSVFSQVVTEQEAVNIASNFLYGFKRNVKSSIAYGEKGKSEIYVVNFNPEGWALVSGDRKAKPIIGYSYKGFFDVNRMAPNVNSWMDYQRKQIAKADANNKFITEWKILEKGKLPELKAICSVDPLLDTEWDQGAGWNRFCPDYAEGPDGKAYVGCVAVAMAQALFYLKYPGKPQGSKSYALEPYGTISLNFDEESEYEWNKMSLKEPDDYNARLLFHCAVAVEMDFGGGGSGAYTTRVPFAFQKYFGFTPSVKTIDRYEDENKWIDLLKEELNNERVMVYSGNPGNGQAGHAFNIDGYAASGYFHFNWGWSGKYDGYFSINSITPGGMDFTNGQTAVIGIAEPYWGPTNITLSNMSINENMPAGTVVGDISITDYSEDDEFFIEVFGDELFMEEGYAPAKFYEENMQLKSLVSFTVGDYPEVAIVRVTDSENLSFEKRFEIVVKEVPVGSELYPIEKIEVYPNPANNSIYIKGISKIEHYKIFDLSGNIVIFSNCYNEKIDVSSLKCGIYFLEIIPANEEFKFFKKIVINR